MENENWNEMYKLANQYYAENGNLLVPNRYIINNIKLGRWISTQRGNYKNNKLTNERINLLEKIGMVWNLMEEQWNECYNYAEEYYKENGNLLIPRQYKTKNSIQLGRWICTQRGLYKQKKLSKEKIELLEKVGIDWNPIDTQWNKCYDLAVKYYNENGNLSIPTEYMINDINLGRWICKQRSNYKTGILTKNKFDLLEKIKMIWEPFDAQWKEFYVLAEKYYKEKGNLLISAEYTTNEGINLGSWIHCQRRNYREKKISKERINLLEEIGMVWKPLDEEWSEYYNLATDYYQKNKNLLIPFRYKTDEGVKLGSWINTQRNSYREKKLSKEKIELLKKIEMVWNAIDAQWENRYKLAVEYYNENGNLLIPSNYITGDKIKLGSWVNTQRYSYKEKRLSEEQIELLERIGMVWNIRNA